MVSLEACLDVMDLMYENQKISRLFVQSPMCAGTGVLASSFVMTVPRQRWEFPLLSWLNFVSCCRERDILPIVKIILQHVLESSLV